MGVCPNCNDSNYERGTACTVCGWEPASREEVEKDRQLREEEHKKEAAKTKEAMVTVAGVVIFFLIVFWIFPVRRASDWFHLTVGEVFSTIVLAAIAAGLVFSKKR